MVEFTLRRSPGNVEIAKVFAAYLLGASAHTNGKELQMGPYRRREGKDDDWTLDASNDYWLHIDREANVASINCRHVHEERIVEAMVALYKAQYHVDD